MSGNNDFNYDIDSILAEFSAYSEKLSGTEQSSPSQEGAPAQAHRPNAGNGSGRSGQPNLPQRFSPEPPQASDHAPVRSSSRRPPVSDDEFVREYRPHSRSSRHEPVPEPGRQAKRGAGQSAGHRTSPAGRRAGSAPVPAASARTNLTGRIFIVLSVLAFCWILVHIHPDSGAVTASSSAAKLNLVERFDTYVNNAASDALSDLTYIPKIYTIPESDIVAPKPDQAKFGSTTDPAEVQAVIDSAAALLDGQTMIWNPDINFVAGSAIRYYCDATILAVTWQEDIEGKCCSCSEVKIAHGSQLKRKVAGDTYSTGVRYYATDMAKECNAVVAINGDFYDYRQIGVTVYQRELYRFAPDRLDSCHITASGDLLFSYAGELTDAEYTRQFIADNDVVFTLSFGPVLVDNGELLPIDNSYPVGEGNRTYSRSAIGQLDQLHYLLMTVNYADGYTTTAKLDQMGRFMYLKGCQKAYELDGGQTSILIMNGEAVNHVDWDNERTMSDIVYFATAIPEDEQ